MGRTPQELMEGDGEGSDSGSGGNVVVGLVDKRGEEYVEEFRSFSGHGQAIGSAAPAAGSDDPTLFEPSSLPEPPAPTAAEGAATTAIQVRLPNGQRRVVKLPVTSTVSELAARVVHGGGNGNGAGIDHSFQLLFGFPPKPLDGAATVEGAGLKGAQVSMKKL